MRPLAPSYQLLRKNIPSINFKFRMGGLNLIRTALKRIESEFAIVVYDHNFDQFEKILLKKGRLQLYQAKDAPSSLIKNGIFVDDVEGLYVKELKSHLEQQGYQNVIQDAIAGWELVARFAQLSIGIGFFPNTILLQTTVIQILPFILSKHLLSIMKSALSSTKG